MYPFSCVLWAIFWPFSLLSENASKTHPKSSHDKFKTASKNGRQEMPYNCIVDTISNRHAVRLVIVHVYDY